MIKYYYTEGVKILMKISEAKELLENLIFTTAGTRLSRTEIMKKMPELVMKSREQNKDNLNVYRVLKIKEDSNIKEHKDSESTSTSLSACIKIASSMPSVVMTKEKTLKLETHILKINVPNDNILLDMKIVIPALKEKLKNHMDKNINLNRWGEKIKISEAFEEIELANEQEIICDLKGLKYESLNCKNNIGFSLSCNLAHLRKGFESIGYEEDLFNQYSMLKPIIDKETENLMLNYIKENDLFPREENKQSIKRKPR